MSNSITLILGILLSFSAFAQDLSVEGFKSRFTLTRNDEGKVTAVRLKKVTSHFSIKPFINQIKADLLSEQKALAKKSLAEREAEVDQFLYDMGLDPYAKNQDGAEEARRFKESILNIGSINVNQAFSELSKRNDFWATFETKLNEAFLFIDPTVLANLEDPRFFYKKAITHRVVVWALNEAKKRFSNLPILNIASFVIVRIHDMMLEQRHFHHNMLLHYFETISEAKLGMTKEEVDRTVSSIYEYQIAPADLMSSNRAARDWLNFGMNSFYMMVRQGNARIQSWNSPFADVPFRDVKKLNFAFVEASEGSARRIYHLHHNAHMFSKKPTLAFDYSNPNKVKRTRALLNLGSVALGFIQMPGWLKSNVESFINSFYVQQVRREGALVGYFESTGNFTMSHSIYNQRTNLYIIE